MISCCFLPVVHAPLHDSHCFSCVTLHSSGTSRGKQAPGRSGKETVLITELPKVFDDSPPDTIVILTVCLPKRFAQVFTAILVPGPNSFLEWAIKATANENCRGRNMFVIDLKNVGRLSFTAFSASSRPTVGRLSALCRRTVARLSADCWPHVGNLLAKCPLRTLVEYQKSLSSQGRTLHIDEK